MRGRPGRHRARRRLQPLSRNPRPPHLRRRLAKRGRRRQGDSGAMSNVAISQTASPPARSISGAGPTWRISIGSKPNSTCWSISDGWPTRRPSARRRKADRRLFYQPAWPATMTAPAASCRHEGMRVSVWSGRRRSSPAGHVEAGVSYALRPLHPLGRRQDRRGFDGDAPLEIEPRLPGRGRAFCGCRGGGRSVYGDLWGRCRSTNPAGMSMASWRRLCRARERLAALARRGWIYASARASSRRAGKQSAFFASMRARASAHRPARRQGRRCGSSRRRGWLSTAQSRVVRLWSCSWVRFSMCQGGVDSAAAPLGGRRKRSEAGGRTSENQERTARTTRTVRIARHLTPA